MSSSRQCGRPACLRITRMQGPLHICSKAPLHLSSQFSLTSFASTAGAAYGCAMPSARSALAWRTPLLHCNRHSAPLQRPAAMQHGTCGALSLRRIARLGSAGSVRPGQHWHCWTVTSTSAKDEHMQGLECRREAEHELNARSSRSHTIFTVRLETLTTGASTTAPVQSCRWHSTLGTQLSLHQAALLMH